MQPKVGIVIVSYNASLAVRTTLAGLSLSNNQTPYSVLLVDNASEMTERKIIRAAFDRHVAAGQSNWKYIQLDRNLGFSGGNNYGIKKFLKDQSITHICLLNSDVIVPDYWIDRLVEKPCDIVSAVTNKADSEQCVPVDYRLELGACLDTTNESLQPGVFEQVNTFSQKWATAWRNNLVACDVTFFCVMLTRSLIEKAGLLDEKFYPGGYEDDDYCARINAMGIKIYLSRDVFIHHFGSASFGQLQEKYFNDKAAKNRGYLERKHGFKVKRRPEKPIVSYQQDILFALERKGDRSLQSTYQQLYVETLSSLVAHYQREFAAIHSHLIHCGHAIPVDIMSMVNEATQYGDINESWAQLQQEITQAFQRSSADKATIGAISNKLDELAAAVYAKAECNRIMHQFLVASGVFSNGQPAAAPKWRFKKINWAIRKGIPFIWRLRGIVFFGGYPYQEREKDGYFQRIKSIDNLFRDRWRIYIDHMKVNGKNSWYDRPAPNVIVFHINNHRHRWFMRLVTALCVLKCRVIYFHSVLRMNDSNFGTFMKWPGIKKLVDIHGVVPEEFRFHNDFFSAGIYDAHEKLAVRKADYVIVVSEAMHRYFKHKYRELLDKATVIVLPIFPDVHSIPHDKSYVDGKPVVVYAGGTHKWQQVPKMLDAIAMTTAFCHHKVFCPDPSEIEAMLPDSLKNNPALLIDSKPFHELLKVYEQCHYGFILREDIIVNHAACPTKLVEYIAMGIIPIVDCEDMGDFKSLGMQFIRLRDFLAGHIPDEAARNSMAANNHNIHIRLQEISQHGKHVLQQAFGVKQDAEAGKLKKVTKRLFPANTPHGKLARKALGKSQPSVQPVITVAANHQPQPVAPVTIVSATPNVPECDILVQVDNFLVGGLENVVLDLNTTLMHSGWRVNLLILGDAGVAAERAKEKGMNVIITRYDADSYRNMLLAMKPRMVITHYSINGVATCAAHKIPVVQVIHNTYMWFSPEQAHEFSEAAKHTTAFIAVSDFVKTYSLKRLGVSPAKCLVIPNGIDTIPFLQTDKEPERARIRAKHGISNDEFVFLNVGSITHQKNHISTVRAFHTVLRYCPDAKLVILGKLYEQGLWKEIQEYITTNGLEKQIIYAGESKNPPAYYAMADAFIHSAFFEGGQLSLLEAVVADLPIVTTEIGFAKHFRGKPGIRLAAPPVEIIDYHGAIWQLQPTATCERDLALHMLKTYTERIRPGFDHSFVNMIDKAYTYKLYDELIRRFFETGHIKIESPVSWPDRVLHKEQKEAKVLSW